MEDTTFDPQSLDKSKNAVGPFESALQNASTNSESLFDMKFDYTG